MPVKDQNKQNEYARRHYRKNRQAQIDRVQKTKPVHRERNKQFVKEFLSDKACVDCGENNPIVLEFDHVNGDKRFNISDMVYRPMGLKTIKEEIAKCEIRCANCHRIKTYERAGRTHRD